MKVGLATVCRNDMLECYQHAKELGIEVDIFIQPNTPQWRKDNITRNNLNIIYFQDENDLIQKMGSYDITSTYEFYGKTAMKLMEKYNNYVAEISWNRPNYGTAWYFDNWQEQCLELAKKRVRKFVARSQSVVDCLIQEGIDSQKIKLIPGTSDTSRFKPGPKPEEYKDKLVFLFIGRVAEQKGIFEIFHSFVRANIPNSILLYRGIQHPTNPWEVRVIEKWTKLLKLEDRVFILPQIEFQKDIHSYYNWGDVFITLPNTDLKFVEQVGVTVPQAMASGLPIITCDYGGQSEFVTPQCGIKVPHRDYVAGAEAMKKMANETLRKGMSYVSRLRAVKYYSTEMFAREIKKVYEEVAS